MDRRAGARRGVAVPVQRADLQRAPLLALLLPELPHRHAPEQTLRSFDYRLRVPAVAGATVLAAGVVGAPAAITGTVRFV